MIILTFLTSESMIIFHEFKSVNRPFENLPARRLFFVRISNGIQDTFTHFETADADPCVAEKHTTIKIKPFYHNPHGPQPKIEIYQSNCFVYITSQGIAEWQMCEQGCSFKAFDKKNF